MTAVRCLGLWAGVDTDPTLGTGRAVCERLLARGVLAKDFHGATLRLAPSLVVEPDELDWAVQALRAVLEEMATPVRDARASPPRPTAGSPWRPLPRPIWVRTTASDVRER